MSARLAVYRQGLRVAGKCIEGPHEDARTLSGAIRCAGCAQRHSAKAKNRTASDRAAGKPPRQKPKTTRMCQCGERPLDPYKKLCAQCREKYAAANYKAKLARLKGPDRSLFR